MVLERLIVGFDPGLGATGWGVIAQKGSALKAVSSGTVTTPVSEPLGARLSMLEAALAGVVAGHAPDEAAVEDAFVARDPKAALKLGQARAIALLVPARAGLPVAEYAATSIKKTVTGSGRAGKDQIRAMVGLLLPRSDPDSEHAADALAVAICHAHMSAGRKRLEAASQVAGGAAR